MKAPWTERDRLDAVRWYEGGMSFRVIGESMSPQRHQVEVAAVLRSLGYGKDLPVPEDALRRAKAGLKEQIELAKRERATSPPYKFQW